MHPGFQGKPFPDKVLYSNDSDHHMFYVGVRVVPCGTRAIFYSPVLFALSIVFILISTTCSFSNTFIDEDPSQNANDTSLWNQSYFIPTCMYSHMFVHNIL